MRRDAHRESGRSESRGAAPDERARGRVQAQSATWYTSKTCQPSIGLKCIR